MVPLIVTEYEAVGGTAKKNPSTCYGEREDSLGRGERI